MPSYDLLCEACDQQFEVFRHGFLRDEDRACPDCDQTATQLFTGFVTARPSSSETPAAGGGCCGGSCGCGG
ncbi:MAG: zinc ribbon domain-containing protein [Thermoleophilia bacterium]|nr:zinc ribbon domain-containing protein [Thermoleophilia bacterium]MDH3725567.1 zinc ribbon domain-containing protein [Thermoleophilia bacterium]